MFLKIFILLAVSSFGSSQAAWNVTCDFDLERIADIIQYLPKQCQDIYKAGPASELYQASLEESRRFVQFSDKLVEYERKVQSTPVNEFPKQDVELRFKIYNTTALNDCAMNIGNRTDLTTDKDRTKEYYNCLEEKRDIMIGMIPK